MTSERNGIVSDGVKSESFQFLTNTTAGDSEASKVGQPTARITDEVISADHRWNVCLSIAHLIYATTRDANGC